MTEGPGAHACGGMSWGTAAWRYSSIGRFEWRRRVRRILSRPLGGGAVWPQCWRCVSWAVSAVALGEGVSWGVGRPGPNLKSGTVCVCGMNGSRKGINTT